MVMPTDLCRASVAGHAQWQVRRHAGQHELRDDQQHNHPVERPGWLPHRSAVFFHCHVISDAEPVARRCVA